MTPCLWNLAFIGLWGFATLCYAATPQLVDKIRLDAPIVSGKTSEDARRIVIQTQGSDGRSPRLQIFEKADALRYEQRGFIALEGNGEFVLSPDGQRALVHLLNEKQQYNKATRHLIIEIDLTRPAAPAEANRREVTARKVVLAPDASSYATSQPSERAGRWQTRVQWVGNPRDPLILEESDYVQPERLSSGGRFLLYAKFNQELQVLDVQGVKPVKHEQPYSGFQRYRCVVALLEDGKILVEDARTPRLGLYTASAGVPRIAVLEHTGENHCSVLSASASSRELVMAIHAGELRKVDLRRPETPKFAGDWRLSAKTYPLAVAQNNLFAAAGERGQELHFFQLEPASAPAIVWSELEAAYQTIMAQYHEETKAKKPIPYFNAVRRLEEAGVPIAIDSPVKGISPQRAAAMFNDYGFLLGKMADRKAIAERFLKRAIALDPRRAVAYLNLADLQQQTLSRHTNWKDKEARSREVANNYRKFVALGGKATESIASFLRGDLRNRDVNDFCGAIANYADAGRLGEIVTGTGINISMGGRKVDLVFTTEGTAHVPAMYAFDATTDEPLRDEPLQEVKEPPLLPPDSENLWGGDNLGLLAYRNGAHILYYRDLAHPVSSVSLSDGSTCRFSAEVTQTVGPKASEPSLCEDLRAGTGRETELVDFHGPVWMTREDVAKRWSETGMVGTRMIDFANDGKPANVAKLGLASGAGAGCDETFFDLVDKNATRFESGPRRELLMQLQGADPSNRYPILPCGNNPSFFKYKGKIYFENKPAVWPPRDAWHQYHRVTRGEEGRVIEVCDFKIKTRVTSKQ
jgi:hypothetical protein